MIDSSTLMKTLFTNNFWLLKRILATLLLGTVQQHLNVDNFSFIDDN